jgi:hypothetical protein
MQLVIAPQFIPLMNQTIVISKMDFVTKNLGVKANTEESTVMNVTPRAILECIQNAKVSKSLKPFCKII